MRQINNKLALLLTSVSLVMTAYITWSFLSKVDKLDRDVSRIVNANQDLNSVIEKQRLTVRRLNFTRNQYRLSNINSAALFRKQLKVLMELRYRQQATIDSLRGLLLIARREAVLDSIYRLQLRLELDRMQNYITRLVADKEVLANELLYQKNQKIIFKDSLYNEIEKKFITQSFKTIAHRKSALGRQMVPVQVSYENLEGVKLSAVEFLSLSFNTSALNVMPIGKDYDYYYTVRVENNKRAAITFIDESGGLSTGPVRMSFIGKDELFTSQITLGKSLVRAIESQLGSVKEGVFVIDINSERNKVPFLITSLRFRLR